MSNILWRRWKSRRSSEMRTERIKTCARVLATALLVVAGSACGGDTNDVAGASPVKLFPIVKEGKWGYMDEKGKVVIEPQYDGAGDFSEGLAWVGKGLIRGYIDKTGTMVIKPRFGWSGSFHSGMAVVFGHRDGQPLGARVVDFYGDDVQMYQPQAGMYYVDRDGKVVEGRCSPADFSEGKACFQRFCIGADGKEIKHDADDVKSFSEGLAAAKKSGKFGYIDHSMKWVIEPQFDLAGPFGDGLAAVAQSDPPAPTSGDYGSWRRSAKKLKWGYVDKSGKVVVPYSFPDADRFSEGLAAVVPPADGQGAGGAVASGTGKKWGYVDKSGAMTVKPQFDYAWRFSEGLGRVLVGEKHGYVDKTGKMAIEPTVDTAWEFSKGLARVGIGTDKEGYIGHDGKYVWEPTE